MKTINKTCLLVCLLFMQTDLLQAQGISVGSGTTFSLGGATLFLPGNWANAGTFNAGTSSVVFNGATGNQTVANTSATSFNNVTVNKDAGDIVFLNTVTVNGTLACTSGDVDLNANTLNLGSSATLAETSGNTVKGNGMIAIAPSPTLSNPENNALNGIGATITSPTNLGITSISRGHTQYTFGSNKSILRYIDIHPANNTNLNAILSFKYDHSELNGATEANLSLYRSIDGGVTWSQAGGTVNTNTNTVTLSGISAFSRWTLASAPSVPTAIALASGNNQSGAINTALANPFVVTVSDVGGSPISGVSVTFTFASTPSGATGQSLSTTTTSTNGSGQASTALTLGNKPGTYTVAATSSGLVGSPVSFFATANAGAATTISLTSGNNQTGTANSGPANPFLVAVTDAGGNPVSGVSVIFAISSVPTGALGQYLTTTSTTTNSSGQASSILTFGSKPGTYTVTASSSGLSGSPVVFTATASAMAAQRFIQSGGNNQLGIILTPLALPFIATVTDAVGSPISGVDVSFVLSSSPSGATGQSLSTTTTTTNSSGQASSVLTLGSRPGTYTITATSVGLSGSPMTFTAYATIGNPALIVLTSGNNQAGTINSTLPAPFVVTSTDLGGNPTPSGGASFAITSMPNGATGQSLSVTLAGANESGQTSTVLTLGKKTGAYTVTASLPGVSGSYVNFTAIATAGPATTFTLESGNNQSGLINSVLTNPFIVTVTDGGGNPIPGVSVNFAFASVPSGAIGQTLSKTSVSTDSNGRASTTLTLGNIAGQYAVIVTSAGLSGSPVTFGAIALVSTTSTLAATSGDNQIGLVSNWLDHPFVVTATKTTGSPLSGASVTFAITSAPNGASGQRLIVTTASTGLDGQATTQLVLGNRPGKYTVTATSSGLAGSPTTFTATATVGIATKLEMTSGWSQRGSVNTPLARPFVVTATDNNDNPIPNVRVDFAFTFVPAGASGQSLTVTSMQTGNDGKGSTVLTLGNKTGYYLVSATSSGLSGSPAGFDGEAIYVPRPASIAVWTGNNQSGVINTVLSSLLAAKVTDTLGNAVSGVSVTYVIASVPSGATGQRLGSTTLTSSGSGLTWDDLTLGNKTGVYTVTVTSSALAGVGAVFTENAIAGATLSLTSGDNQMGVPGAQLASLLVATVRDLSGNPVSGMNVSFALSSSPSGATGQLISNTTSFSDLSGQASTLLTLGNKTGAYTVTATFNGLSGYPVTFTANAIAGNPAPSLTGISISRAGRGSQINVMLTGANFVQGVSTVSFGSSITVNSQSVVSANQIVANISISSVASVGTRDVSVTNAAPGGGTALLANAFTIDTSVPTGVDGSPGGVPGDYVLCDAYPNPFNPSTRIVFSIPKRTQVKLNILDVLGREVALLVDDERAAGIYEVRCDAGSLPSGMYFYRLQAGEFLDTKRMILLK